MQQRSMRFPADVSYVAAARDFATAVADELGSPVCRDDLALVVSELVANAAEHQAGEAELIVRVHPTGDLDIEVSDHDPTIPVAIPSTPWDVEGHRGLYLVGAISTSWGVSPEPDGKRIWARLSTPR